jgi:choline dehydrogenase-like flavoprotein
MTRAHELLDEGLRRTGIGHVDRTGLDESSTLESGRHHMGTTRMHCDPRRGVVDENCRVHGLGNLFIAGSSVFPTAGYANPTLTIVALAIRLADHIRLLHGDGKV